jgi:hypothetical protein
MLLFFVGYEPSAILARRYDPPPQYWQGRYVPCAMNMMPVAMLGPMQRHWQHFKGNGDTAVEPVKKPTQVLPIPTV